MRDMMEAGDEEPRPSPREARSATSAAAHRSAHRRARVDANHSVQGSFDLKLNVNHRFFKDFVLAELVMI